MKTIRLLISVIILMTAFRSSSQNFYTIKANLQHYYDSLIQIKGINNMQGSGYNPFMRWVDYWEPKLYPTGDFSAYKQDWLNDLSMISNLNSTVSVNWKFIGPQSMPDYNPQANEQSSSGVGQIHYILFDPNDQTYKTIYACSGGGGVFKSIDGGNNWINAGTDKGLKNTGVSSIAISEINPDVWFLSTGHAEGMPGGTLWSSSIGVYRTLNGGVSFEPMGLDNVVQMRKIIIVRDNLNKGHIFVVTSSGLYECENAYSPNPSWNNNGNPIIQGDFYDIEVSPVLSDSTIYASGTEGTGIYKYNWANDQYTTLNLSNFLVDIERRISIEISAAAPNYLFAVATRYHTTNSALYRFDLQNINQPAFAMGTLNTTFGYSIEPGVGGERAMGWAVSPVLNTNNQLYIYHGNTAPIYQSDQALGSNPISNWTSVTGPDYPSCKIHVDMHYITFSPDGSEIWVGCDGGIYKSTNNANTYNNWVEMNNGLGVATIHHIATSDDDPNVALSGQFDCGSNLYSKNTSDWNSKHVGGGDGFKCAFEKYEPCTLYVSSQNAWIRKSFDCGLSYSNILPGGHWGTYFILDPNNNSTLYLISYDGLKQSIDAGASWHIHSNFPGLPLDTNGNIIQSTGRVAVSPNNSNYIYASWIASNTYSPSPKQRIYKSSNGGGNDTTKWTQVLDINNSYNGYWINSIVVDEINPDIIYVAAGPSVYKINTITGVWINLAIPDSNNLIGHIKCLVQELGSPNILYAGGTMGIFYWDQLSQTWINMTKDSNIPNTEISDMVINYTTNKLIVGTYGRGVWEGDLPCIPPSSGTHFLTSNETWSGRITSAPIHTIIGSGKELTITGDVCFSVGSDVTVEAGGKLIIDGGRLTTRCGEMWYGIHVLGDHNQPQLPLSNQGLVIIKNGGTIENAMVGISNIPSSCIGFCYGTGGIINAYDAKFINNQIAIRLYPYKNIYSGYSNPSPNLSSIRKCTFETNDNYKGTSPFCCFIDLNDVYINKFEGNTLANYSNEDVSLDNNGIGIKSYNSYLTVKPLCISQSQPCTQFEKNNFKNLSYGIKIFNDNPHITTTIDDNEFVNCYRGIYLNLTNSAVVTKNNFQIAAAQSSELPYGLYIDGGKGFKVEENNCTSYSDFEGTIGIIINRTGAENNEIYKNNCEGINIGIQSQYENKDATLGSVKGLRLFCNTFNNPYYDIRVGGKNDFPNQHGMGIAEAQQYSTGDPNIPYLPAGNQFSFSSLGYDYDFSNYDAEFLNYFYYDGSPSNKYEPTYYSNIKLEPRVNENTCPSKTNNGTMSLSEFYDNLHFAKIALNSSSLILNIWKDGGLEDLGEEIETTGPWEAYQQFNDLMNISPYLSDKTLIAMIENPVFTSLMVKLVMLANPQGARSDAVMQAIYDRNPPLPQNYIDEILAGADAPSQLELLEADVAADYHLFRSIGEDIKRNYRNDTVNTWIADSLIAFIGRQPDLNDKYELAATYLGFRMYEDMQNTLDAIPNSFELNEEQTVDYNNLISIFGIAREMYENEIFTEGLSETQRNTLENMLAMQRPYVSQFSLSLLKRDNPEYMYNEVIIEPEELLYEIAPPEKKMEHGAVTEDNILTIYPNPAYTHVTVKYKTSEMRYLILWMKMHDSNGKVVLTKLLKGGDNEELIGLGELRPGSYTVILYADEEMIATEKLNVIK